MVSLLFTQFYDGNSGVVVVQKGGLDHLQRNY